jgi:hypothetical protein
MENFRIRIKFLVKIMGLFETPNDYKLYKGHIITFRRNPYSESYGASHIELFESTNSNEVIGHVSGELGTSDSDNFDCDILSELIDCYFVGSDSTHQCTITLMLVENTTHRVTGSLMAVRLSCNEEDVAFFNAILNNFNKIFELV